MKILVDTNVLLSAAWRDRLPEKVAQFAATDVGCQWIVTVDILTEYVEVLQRPKFGLPAGLLQQWAELIDMRTLVVPTPPIDIGQSRDPKDAMFLAAALAHDADFLITGDKDLLQAKSSVKTRIVTVAEFAAEFGIR